MALWTNMFDLPVCSCTLSLTLSQHPNNAPTTTITIQQKPMGRPTNSIRLFFLISISISISISSSSSIPKFQEPFVGVTIGTDVSDLLSASELVSFLATQQITHIRLYDADPAFLSSFRDPKVKILLGIPNSQLIAFASSPATAATWVARHVTPFHPRSFTVSAVALGDDVLSSQPAFVHSMLPALYSLHSLLSVLDPPIPVSTPLPFSVVLDPFPPSQAFFNQTAADSLISPLLGFLSTTSSPLMMNLYPYYSLVKSNGVVPLDNALFKPLPPSLEMVDPNTLLHYTNVFDAMVDAVYFSMRNLNVSDVEVLVTETGWPSLGSGVEKRFATRDNADTYNSNLIKHVMERDGTPLHPEMQSSVYVYELFNEDLRPGPLSEKNWGLFYGNGTPVYLLRLEGSGGFLANDTTNRTFCVVADGVDAKQLQAALDWACGPGRANCSEIQPGEACYKPNNVRNHASFAFDSYYQMEGKATGSCYFQGAAMVTTTDPSYKNCIFPGSKEMNNVTMGGGTNVSSEISKADGIYIHHKPWIGNQHFLCFVHIALSMIVAVALSTCTPWT